GSVWDALSGTDPLDAWRAVWALAADPLGPDLLRTKATVFAPRPADQVNRWLADLGADRYPLREAATRGLQKVRRAVEPDLRAARRRATSEEARERLDRLLANISPERTPLEWVQLRAVTALELAGTPMSRQLLTEWAAGAPEARLTIDAKAALGRIA